MGVGTHITWRIKTTCVDISTVESSIFIKIHNEMREITGRGANQEERVCRYRSLYTGTCATCLGAHRSTSVRQILKKLPIEPHPLESTFLQVFVGWQNF